MDYQDLGRRIRALREKNGWAQWDMAERVGVSTSFIGHIERGTRKASLETLVAIANALGVGTDRLLRGSLDETIAGQLSTALSDGQKRALRNILSVIQDNLDNWEELQ